MKITFTADDGTHFDNEEDCRKYEAGQAPFQRFQKLLEDNDIYLPDKPRGSAASSMSFAEGEQLEDVASGLLYSALYDWGLEGVWQMREAILGLAAVIREAEAG